MRSAALGLNEAPLLCGKAADLRGVNRARKPSGVVKFIFCGRKIGQKQIPMAEMCQLTAKTPAYGGDPVLLEWQVGGRNCDQPGEDRRRLFVWSHHVMPFARVHDVA